MGCVDGIRGLDGGIRDTGGWGKRGGKEKERRLRSLTTVFLFTNDISACRPMPMQESLLCRVKTHYG